MEGFWDSIKKFKERKSELWSETNKMKESWWRGRSEEAEEKACATR
jgi:hypothetical protein